MNWSSRNRLAIIFSANILYFTSKKRNLCFCSTSRTPSRSAFQRFALRVAPTCVCNLCFNKLRVCVIIAFVTSTVVIRTNEWNRKKKISRKIRQKPNVTACAYNVRHGRSTSGIVFILVYFWSNVMAIDRNITQQNNIWKLNAGSGITETNVFFFFSLLVFAGISRDSFHKRRATGGKRKQLRKKRKFELGRPAANTKVSWIALH